MKVINMTNDEYDGKCMGSCYKCFGSATKKPMQFNACAKCDASEEPMLWYVCMAGYPVLLGSTDSVQFCACVRCTEESMYAALGAWCCWVARTL